MELENVSILWYKQYWSGEEKKEGINEKRYHIHAQEYFCV